LEAKAARSVTKERDLASEAWKQCIGMVSQRAMRTYIVVSVLYHERNALASNTTLILPRLFQQALFGYRHIAQQRAVGESDAGVVVDDGCGRGIVLADGLEEGRALESGCHCRGRAGEGT
jgi:hypothetical protein